MGKLPATSRSEKRQAVVLRLKAAGRPSGRSRIGFEHVGPRGRRRVVPDPEAQAIIALIIELRDTWGLSWQRVSDELHAHLARTTGKELRPRGFREGWGPAVCRRAYLRARQPAIPELPSVGLLYTLWVPGSDDPPESPYAERRLRYAARQLTGPYTRFARYFGGPDALDRIEQVLRQRGPDATGPLEERLQPADWVLLLASRCFQPENALVRRWSPRGVKFFYADWLEADREAERRRAKTRKGLAP